MKYRTIEEWETQFRLWAGGPGDTELQRCENAERMIRNAIAESPALNTLDIEVFSQGSFKNVTNIARDSDIDVSVCLLDAWYYEIPVGTTPADFNIGPTNLEYGAYKESVLAALTDYFEEGITPGNKAIVIHSNSYRIDADVVPNWQFREYYDAANPSAFRTGVRFRTDDGNWITNWPKQHIECGIQKNSRTKKRFKRMARILKSIQVEILEQKIFKNRLPSFLIESLVFNVPDDHFGSSNYRDDVRSILAFLFNNTRPLDECSTWTEVNEVKYLFHETQPWTKAQAHLLVDSAWNYLGFE